MSYDLDTKIVTEDGNLKIGRFQDCTPIAEFAKNQQKAGFLGSSDMRHAARIPNVIIEKYCNDHNILFNEFMGNREHMRRVLNDPSLSHFRIWQGKA